MSTPDIAEVLEHASVQDQIALDPIVVAANAAFDRIGTHRLLFRRDWLPFIDGVYHLSIQAWEATGRRKRLDGKPDWTYDPVQVEFRRLIRDLPWAGYIQDRRTLLSVIRKIGDERERFLEWYDHPDREEMRERVGHPLRLWQKFEKDELNPTSNVGRDNPNIDDDSDDEQADNARRMDEQIAIIRELEARATTDADRIRELESENERLRTRVAELERELARYRAVEAVS